MLAAIPYNDNPIFLHSDESLMPKNKKTWCGGLRLRSCVEGWGGTPAHAGELLRHA